MNIKSFLDKEQYFERFSSLDKKSRKCTHNCKDVFIDSVRPPTTIERALIHNACREAFLRIPGDSKLATIISHQPDNALIFNSGEYAFPHTHGNIMLFHENYVRQTPTTIIHEAIHIFQRYYPLETNILLQNVWGFKMVGLRPAVHDWRSNPDTNDILYADPNNRIITSHMNPNDYKLLDSRDHPYEIMAYRLADEIYNGTSSGATLDWIKKYLYGK
jgi:hypothetical protein